MPTLADSDLGTLLKGVRAGDEWAAVELARRYEPEIRRIARVRLKAMHLHRLLDSADVCQSVFLRFFSGVSTGQIELTSPEHLLGLLVTMTVNKVRDLSRRSRAQRRGGGAALVSAAAIAGVPDPRPGPEAIVALREMSAEIRARLSLAERFLADQRDQGRDWTDIAADLGEGPDVIRKRLSRGLQRAARACGLADGMGHARGCSRTRD